MLLVTDLGRPERFLNMLRVFKVTSPMSVGSWILLASGGATTTAAVCEKCSAAAGQAARQSSSLLSPGAPLAAYTATLISDTAVPVWHEARRELPFIFVTGSAASAGAAATLFLPPRAATPARRLAIAGVAAGNVATAAMERRLGFVWRSPTGRKRPDG